ncbi:anti-sigma factor [Patulibacter americanus]|uniref:anti-sigma factor n=1 Tax=Patulibacter americanus TaxID=588672 RepID=UPI0003B77BA9|nr:anti-sigma factor [Patulibacter americanus]
MSRQDPEELLVGDLTPDELTAMRGRAANDPDLAAALSLAEALSAADADVWRAAETPSLRFAPDGAGRELPVWSRLCIRSDARQHSVGAPFVTALATVLLVVGLGAGFLLRGGLDGGPETDTRLEAAAPVSLVRAGTAPVDAGGVARMVAGGDGRMVVRVHGLPPTGDRGWYQVWMHGSGRTVSVGNFRVRADGTGVVKMPLRVDPRRYPAMDVTLQTPADGNRHSGVSVLRSSGAA